MTPIVTVKLKETKWQKFWRRFTRRTPFWKQRPDDAAQSPQRWFIGGAVGDILNVVFPMVGGAAVIAMLVVLVAAPILLSPDFLTVGLADPIGRGLAAACLATGQCNVQYLLLGTVLAVLILALIALVILWPSESEVIDEADTIVAVRETGAELYGLVVRLRADLVLAGVLPLSDEEKAEAADGD